MKNAILSIFFLSTSTLSLAQFAGPAGTSGSTAMHKDSSVFVNWANNAQLQLGLIDIANPFGGTASTGDANSPTGIPDGSCVSLGDSGVAILTFPQPITNEPGPDFAVFENGFSDAFLELAFVEVSSDGINFHRFPAVSNTPTDNQIGPFDALGDATLLNNLAGKYRVNFGTPFDLQELDGIFGLNTMAITHVKIIDVVGMISGNHIQYDSNGNAINDPYATAFPQGGFDLDAIGVIHQGPLGVSEQSGGFGIYPNPVNRYGTIHISSTQKIEQLTLVSLNGQMISRSNSSTIDLDNVSPGTYFLQIQTEDFKETSKIVVQ
ncbi:MAG: T9SS type A sorting domain-containing protein [Crocinitomicaceae bacterium]|nr:T9SS type A sorting domain-containing protein [Crocinitomicaceae bacterium]